MDFSSYITIKNITPYKLILIDSHVMHGNFTTFPPQTIPSYNPGADEPIAKFQIKDTSNAAYGSEGSLTYIVEGTKTNVQLFFGCPYCTDNYARFQCSYDNNYFRLLVSFRGTNCGDPESSSWGTFPSKGHPLILEFQIGSVEYIIS